MLAAIVSRLHVLCNILIRAPPREMDGFDAAGKRAVVIGATNRKSDLDPALMSRFDLVRACGPWHGRVARPGWWHSA